MNYSQCLVQEAILNPIAQKLSEHVNSGKS